MREITHTGIGVQLQSDGSGLGGVGEGGALGKVSYPRISTRDKVECEGNVGHLSLKVSMDESVSWCKGDVNVQHQNLHSVTRGISSGETIVVGLNITTCRCIASPTHQLSKAVITTL